MSIPIDTIKARTYYDDDAEVVLDPTVSYVDNGTPKCSQDDLEQKDYMVVGEAYNGVRADVLETSNRNVPFLNLLPEYLSDFQYSELYKFFDCYLNTMYELERDQEVHTGGTSIVPVTTTETVITTPYAPAVVVDSFIGNGTDAFIEKDTPRAVSNFVGLAFSLKVNSFVSGYQKIVYMYSTDPTIPSHNKAMVQIILFDDGRLRIVSVIRDPVDGNGTHCYTDVGSITLGTRNRIQLFTRPDDNRNFDVYVDGTQINCVRTVGTVPSTKQLQEPDVIYIGGIDTSATNGDFEIDDLYISYDPDFSLPSSIASYAEQPNSLEDNRPFYSVKEHFTQVTPDALPSDWLGGAVQGSVEVIPEVLEVTEEVETTVYEEVVTSTIIDKTYHISLLEKINRIRDFDNALDIDWEMITEFAKDRGFEFTLLNDFEDVGVSVGFKKSVRGLLDALPTIFSTKGTTDSIRIIFSLLGFYVDVNQRYYKLDYNTASPNEHLGGYKQDLSLGSIKDFKSELAFHRDIYKHSDDLDLIESMPDFRIDNYIGLIKDGTVEETTTTETVITTPYAPAVVVDSLIGNGVDSGVYIGALDLSSPNNICFTCHIKPTAVDGVRNIVNMQDIPSGTNPFQISIYQEKLTFYATNSVVNILVQSDMALSANVEYEIFVRLSNLDTVTMEVNKVSIPVTIVSQGVGTSPPLLSSYNVTLGNQATYIFAGDIYEAYFSTNVLATTTETTIQYATSEEHFTQVAPDVVPVVYDSFIGDGIDGYIKLATHTFTDFISFKAHIEIDATPTGNGYIYSYNEDIPSAIQPPFRVFITPDRKIQVMAYGSFPSSVDVRKYIRTNEVIALNTRTEVFCYLDLSSATNKIQVFIDGVLATIDVEDNDPFSSLYTPTNPVNTCGCIISSGNRIAFFDGEISELYTSTNPLAITPALIEQYATSEEHFTQVAPDVVPVVIEPSKLVINSTEYNTKKIGDLEWMTENLSYANGSYMYPNNDVNEVGEYGFLYYYQTAVNLIPSGWRLPTKEDFEALISETNQTNTNAGKYLKEDASFWLNGGTVVNNDLGFSSRGAGVVWGTDPNNGYIPNVPFKSRTVFFTSTPSATGEGWYWCLNINDSGSVTFTSEWLTINNANRRNFSVRYVRDWEDSTKQGWIGGAVQGEVKEGWLGGAVQGSVEITPEVLEVTEEVETTVVTASDSLSSRIGLSKIKHSPIYDFDLLVPLENISNAPQRIMIATENLHKIRPINSVFNIDSIAVDLGNVLDINVKGELGILLEDFLDAENQGLEFEDDSLSELYDNEVALNNGQYILYNELTNKYRYFGTSNIQDSFIGTSTTTNYKDDNRITIAPYDVSTITMGMIKPNIQDIVDNNITVNKAEIRFTLMSLIGKHTWSDDIVIRAYPMKVDWDREFTNNTNRLSNANWSDLSTVTKLKPSHHYIGNSIIDNTASPSGYDFIAHPNAEYSTYGAYDISTINLVDNGVVQGIFDEHGVNILNDNIRFPDGWSWELLNDPQYILDKDYEFVVDITECVKYIMNELGNGGSDFGILLEAHQSYENIYTSLETIPTFHGSTSPQFNRRPRIVIS